MGAALTVTIIIFSLPSSFLFGVFALGSDPNPLRRAGHYGPADHRVAYTWASWAFMALALAAGIAHTKGWL